VRRGFLDSYSEPVCLSIQTDHKKSNDAIHWPTFNVNDRGRFTPLEVPMTVTVPDGVPLFPPPPLPPLPPQALSHARLNISGARATTKRRFDCFASTVEVARSKAINTARSGNTIRANGRMFGCFL